MAPFRVSRTSPDLMIHQWAKWRAENRTWGRGPSVNLRWLEYERDAYTVLQFHYNPQLLKEHAIVPLLG